MMWQILSLLKVLLVSSHFSVDASLTRVRKSMHADSGFILPRTRRFLNSIFLFTVPQRKYLGYNDWDALYRHTFT